MTEKLLQYLESHYAPQDYPVIRAQYNDFQGPPTVCRIEDIGGYSVVF